MKGKKYNNIISENEFEIVVSDNLGRTFKISPEDKDILNYYWGVNTQGYVIRGIKFPGGRKNYLLHQELLNDKYIDHKDGNKSNNLRSNLRKANNSLNQANRDKPKGGKQTSKYKGVSWYKRDSVWRSAIKSISLGVYKTEEEAALAYNKKALELYGEFAKLNVID